MAKKVQVLVVDDSALCRQLIVDALGRDPDIEVIGQAENGEDAIAKVLTLKPNVITMDVDMPVLDGLTATERIMGETPTPILVLTADPSNQAPELTHRALAVGALALQVKPALDAGPDAWNLAREVKLLSTVKVIRHLRGTRKTSSSFLALTPVSTTEPEPPLVSAPFGLVAIGGSTGGPQVLQKLLSELPAEFPAPIVVVQHINAAFSDSLVGWLQSTSKLKVKVAKDGDLLAPGVVLIAPPGHHLSVPVRGKVSVAPGEPREGHVPSVSTLMESAAKAYGRRALGLVLTGMGADGAEGMAAIKAAGGRTLIQSQDSCVVFGMPGAALAKQAVDHIVHGDELATALVKLARGGELPRPS